MEITFYSHHLFVWRIIRNANVNANDSHIDSGMHKEVDWLVIVGRSEK